MSTAVPSSGRLRPRGSGSSTPRTRLASTDCSSASPASRQTKTRSTAACLRNWSSASSRHPLDTSLLHVALRGYQAFGARFALTQRRSIVGDEMGLGKTIEALAAMCHVASQGGTHFLVVCPASVLVNWDHEIKNRTQLGRFRLHGPDRDRTARLWKRRGGVAVTTYDSLKALPDLGIRIDMLTVDEAHYIKNPVAQRTAGRPGGGSREPHRTLYPHRHADGEPRRRVPHPRPPIYNRAVATRHPRRSTGSLARTGGFDGPLRPSICAATKRTFSTELPPRI